MNSSFFQDELARRFYHHHHHHFPSYSSSATTSDFLLPPPPPPPPPLSATPQQQTSPPSLPPTCYHLATLSPFPLHMQVFFFLLYSSTIVASVVGNASVLLVHSKLLSRGGYSRCSNGGGNGARGGGGGGKSTSGPPSCSASGNIYRYINNLAVSDLMLSLLSVPFTFTNVVTGHWPYAAWLCPPAQYFQLLSVFITSQTLTIIGIEREERKLPYLITLHPLSRAAEWIKSHCGHLLLGTWAAGAAYALFPVLDTAVRRFHLQGATYWQCVAGQMGGNSGGSQQQLYIWANFALTFALPLAIMGTSYVAITRRLRVSGRRNNFIAQYLFSTRSHRVALVFLEKKEDVINGQATVSTKSLDQRSKTIKMLMTVLLVFFICWAPVKLYQFLLSHGYIDMCSERSYHLWLYVYITCHWLAMANCFCNPLIYSFMSARFRKNLLKTCRSLRKSAFVAFGGLSYTESQTSLEVINGNVQQQQQQLKMANSNHNHRNNSSNIL
ncbi:hypothetical protein TYRP_005222 [Tyrophagus putrescentiae]|nr:hypothetical protein TYRP_005222 [Tyrophagus putrescentiae]